MARISVIVPVYKVESYLRRCVDSILAQTCRDFELILVDDGSPDRCGAICEEYAHKDPRVVAIHRQNGGLSAARNTGIDWAFANSDSEYLSFVDSDDWVDESYLEELCRGVGHGCAIAAVDAFRTMEGRPDAADAAWTRIDPSTYWTEATFRNSAWGKLFRRQLFETVRFPEGKIYEDAYVIYRIVFAASSVAYCAKPLYWYFQRADSIIGIAWNPSRLQAIVPLREQLAFFERGNLLKAARMVAAELAGVLSEGIAGLSGAKAGEEPDDLKTELRGLLAKYQFSLVGNPDLWRTIVPVRARAVKLFTRMRGVLRRRGLMGTIRRLLSDVQRR